MMAQRSELFSLRNVILMGLIMTILYGAYSYNALKSSVSKSSINAQNYKVEAEQYNLQLKASLKSRTSCLKDLKQLRNSMWELKSKISDAETEVNKQKHDAEAKLISQKKELEMCRSQFDSLQKELLKLKEDDRAKNAKSKEEEEEKEKRVKTLNTEHEMAVSKLKDQVEDLKKENEKLKSELNAAKSNVHVPDTPAKPQPKRSSEDESPRQMQPPGGKKPGRPKMLGNVTTSLTDTHKGSEKKNKSTSPVTLTSPGASKPETHGGFEVKKKTINPLIVTLPGSSTKGKAEKEKPQVPKPTVAVERKLRSKDLESNVRDPDRPSDDKGDASREKKQGLQSGNALRSEEKLNAEKKDTHKDGEKVADSAKERKPEGGSILERQPLDGSPLRRKQEDSGRAPQDGEGGFKRVAKLRPRSDNQVDQEGKLRGGDKSFGRGEREEGKLGDKTRLAFHPPDDEKKDDKKDEKKDERSLDGNPLRKSALAMAQIRKSRDSGVAAAASKDEKQEQQVAMPLPQAAAKRNKEPNQLPLPERDGGGVALEKDRSKSKDDLGSLL